MDRLVKLLEKMERGAIVPNLSLEQQEIEAVLGQRDNPSFAEVWMNAFRQIEIKKGSNQDAEPRIFKLREMAYLQAYERWHSPDLAAYISDDFGLIGDALVIDYENDWVNRLLHTYLTLQFPYGNLQEYAGQLGDDL